MNMKCAAVIDRPGLLSRAAVSAASGDRLFQFGNPRLDASLPAPAEQQEGKQQPPHQQVSRDQQGSGAGRLSSSLYRHELRRARAGVSNGGRSGFGLGLGHEGVSVVDLAGGNGVFFDPGYARLCVR